MKLYAQMGYGPKDKIKEGLNKGFINGAIYNPIYATPDKLIDLIKIHEKYTESEILFDPNFYPTFLPRDKIKLGCLENWNYFQSHKTSDLEININIDKILNDFYQDIKDINLTSIITPNIYISKSLDSSEAVISKNFIRQARNIHSKNNDERPLFATLAICREALIDKNNFKDFTNQLTAIEGIDGIYLVIGSRSTDVSDIYDRDIISNWLYLNHILDINGIDVINGYSDFMSPFLGAAGAHASAIGWHQKLKIFTINQYFPQGGGRQPLFKYFSKKLFNRILVPTEFDEIIKVIPSVLNGLSMDGKFPDPQRLDEILQIWQALQSLNLELTNSQYYIKNLHKCLKSIESAKNTYINIDTSVHLPLDNKSKDFHLEELKCGIIQFMKEAEIH